MSAVPVSRFLLDFASDEGDAASGPPGNRSERAAMDQEAVQAQAQARAEKHAAEIEAAYERGISDGRAEALATAEVRMSEQVKRHKAEMAAERQAWIRNESEKLAEGLAKGLKGLVAEIANSAARALARVLSDKARRQALAEMSSILNDFVSRQNGVAIEVSGPEDFVDMLHDSLRAHQIQITAVPGDDCDVQVRCGQTLLETELGALAHRIGEVLP